MSMLLRPAMALIAIFLLAHVGFGADQDKAKSALLQTDRDFSRVSVEKGAGEAFRLYLADEALSLPDGAAPVIGREAIAQSVQALKDSLLLEWQPQDAEVAKKGDLGYTWGLYTVSRVDAAGKHLLFEGKYLTVWKKIHGEWKALVDMGNQNPPPKSQ